MAAVQEAARPPMSKLGAAPETPFLLAGRKTRSIAVLPSRSGQASASVEETGALRAGLAASIASLTGATEARGIRFRAVVPAPGRLGC
jgi:hypothetical protein